MDIFRSYMIKELIGGFCFTILPRLNKEYSEQKITEKYTLIEFSKYLQMSIDEIYKEFNENIDKIEKFGLNIRKLALNSGVNSVDEFVDYIKENLEESFNRDVIIETIEFISELFQKNKYKIHFNSELSDDNIETFSITVPDEDKEIFDTIDSNIDCAYHSLGGISLIHLLYDGIKGNDSVINRSNDYGLGIYFTEYYQNAFGNITISCIIKNKNVADITRRFFVQNKYEVMPTYVTIFAKNHSIKAIQSGRETSYLKIVNKIEKNIKHFSHCFDINDESSILDDTITSVNINGYNIENDNKNIMDKILELPKLNSISMKSCYMNTPKILNIIEHLSDKVEIMYLDNVPKNFKTLNGMKISPNLSLLFIDIQPIIVYFDMHRFNDYRMDEKLLNKIIDKAINEFIGDFKISENTTIAGIPNLILDRIPHY